MKLSYLAEEVQVEPVLHLLEFAVSSRSLVELGHSVRTAPTSLAQAVLPDHLVH